MKIRLALWAPVASHVILPLLIVTTTLIVEMLPSMEASG